MARREKKSKIGGIIFFIIVFLIIAGISFLRIRSRFQEDENNQPNGTGDELQVIAIEMRGKYGDSFLIKYNDFEILVDAGTKTDKEYVQDALEEFVTDDKLDILMVSHLHADHIGDMTDVSFFEDIDIDVLKIVDAGTKPTSKTAENYVAMRDELVSDGATYYPYYDIINNDEIGTVWYLDSEEKLYIEFFDTGEVPTVNEDVDDLNASSIAFTLNYNNNKWFFAGDLPDFCEEDLVNSMKASKSEYFKESDHVVYKTCHHGSKTSNGDTLLSYVKPDIIFTMAGIISGKEADDPIVDQHPYLEALERMKKYTDKIYWSSINGLTIFKSTGNEVTFTSRGRTVDYYYKGSIVSKEEEKNVTIFESKWYKALTE